MDPSSFTPTPTRTEEPTPTTIVIATATPSPTETMTPTPSPTPTATPEETPFIACVGDCDLNGCIGIHELVKGVAIALGQMDIDDCLPFDPDRDGKVEVHELVQGVDNALHACRGTPCRHIFSLSNI